MTVKDTAKLILDYDKNSEIKPANAKEICSVKELEEYKVVEIIEELLFYPKKLMKFIKELKKANRRCKIYVFTDCLWLDDYQKILNLVDGVTVMLGADATEEDIRNLKYMSKNLYGESIDMRLFVNVEVYGRYDLSNIRMGAWDVVRKVVHIEERELADNEELLYLQI